MVESNATALRCAPRPGAQMRRVLLAAGIAVTLLATLFSSAASAHLRHHHVRRHPSRRALRHRCRYAHTRVGTVSRRKLQRAVVCLINQQRIRRGLPRLRASRRLNRSAQGWTNAMVRHGFFSHGSDFASRISAVGFNWSVVGENIAAGFQTPSAVVRGWMNSPGHCRNILTPTFRFVGTGVSRQGIPGAGPVGTWTQDFALPMFSRPPSGNWGPADGCPY